MARKSADIELKVDPDLVVDVDLGDATVLTPSTPAPAPAVTESVFATPARRIMLRNSGADVGHYSFQGRSYKLAGGRHIFLNEKPDWASGEIVVKVFEE